MNNKEKRKSRVNMRQVMIAAGRGYDLDFRGEDTNPYLKKNRPIKIREARAPENLGYEVNERYIKWRGTPMPRVNNPLPGTPELVFAAKRFYYRGDPWCILRNRIMTILCCIDEPWKEAHEILWRVVPIENWIEALRLAKPGMISCVAWREWTLRIRDRIPYIKFWQDPRWWESRHHDDILMRSDETLEMQLEKIERDRARA